jgi:hypothetical protein
MTRRGKSILRAPPRAPCRLWRWPRSRFAQPGATGRPPCATRWPLQAAASDALRSGSPRRTSAGSGGLRVALVLSVSAVALCCSGGGPGACAGMRGTVYNVTKSPTLNTGEWLDPSGAEADGGSYARTTVTGATHYYYGFDFDIPQGSDVVVEGIEVLDDTWSTGTPIISRGVRVSLSWNGGVDWTPAKTHYIGAFEGAYSSGGPTDAWGRLWSPTEINGDSFQLRVEALGTRPDETRLDWIRVTVRYTVDKSPPTLAILEPTNRTYSDLPIRLIYEAYDDVGVRCCWCRLDGGDIEILTGRDNTVLDVDEGSHTVQLFVMDTSNKVVSQSVEFSLEMRPSQPALALYDCSAPDSCYNQYFAEILKTEGIVGFQHADMAHYRQGYYPLEAYDLLVLLGPLTPSASLVREIKDYVWNGGSILAIKPDPELAELFGLAPVAGKLADCYVGVDTLVSVGTVRGGAPIQCHSEADKYELAGARGVAWLYSDREHKTQYPAVTYYNYGSGHSVAFNYSLARTVVLLHQGNDRLPDMTDADRDGKYRPQDYFAHGFYDSANATIPQADEHQSLLVNAIYYLADFKLPMPRLWYFPDYSMAMALISGDFGKSDGAGDSIATHFANIVSSYGGRAHLNVLGQDLSAATYDSLAGGGHSLGPHTFVGDKPSLEEMKDGIHKEVVNFRNKYGATGRVNLPHRNISVGYWETAAFFARHGLKMIGFNGSPINTSPFYGYLFGSALPFKIVKNEDDYGVLDAYYMPMVISDMVIISYGHYDEAGASGVSRRVLDDLQSSYHGVALMNFHPKNVYENLGGVEESWFRSTLDYCRSNRIPMWSSERFYDYWVKRSATQFVDIDYAVDKLTFRVIDAPENATLMIPSAFGEDRVCSIKVGGVDLEYRIEEIDGREYALFLAGGSDLSVEATYCPESRE